MRLFIDARYIRTDFHDGISRFSTSLINATAALADLTVVISDERQLEKLDVDVPWVKIHAPTSPLEPTASLRLNQYHPDIVFSPMQTIGTAGRKFGLIKTLHDLIYYQHRTPPKNLPQFVRGLWYMYHSVYWPQRMLLNSADAVATVSYTTKSLIEKHQLTDRPIQVISNAPQPVAEPRDPGKEPRKSLVYMGSFMRYKNVELIIQAMKHLPGYTLQLLSKIDDRRQADYQQLAQSLGLSSGAVHFHHGVSDEEYREHLREASALVTMSQAEGYGLPVAEAMAEGTPVVLSDLEIFREIAGNDGFAAQFVNLDSSDAAQQLAGFVRNLEEQQFFSHASKNAVQQAQTYDWANSAHQLLDLAERVHRTRMG